MDRRKYLKEKLFKPQAEGSKSDLYASDRIQLGITEAILRDLAAKTLEFIVEFDERGCLFLRPHQDDIRFMRLSELAADIQAAESVGDKDTSAFLSSLMQTVEKVDLKKEIPIALCDHLGVKLMLIDVENPVGQLCLELSFDTKKGRQ